MAFVNNERFEKFEKKVWLSSPTMYPESMRYVMEAYKTNWMSTVGANINEVEKVAANISETTYLYEACRCKIVWKATGWCWSIEWKTSILYRYDIQCNFKSSCL